MMFSCVVVSNVSWLAEIGGNTADFSIFRRKGSCGTLAYAYKIPRICLIPKSGSTSFVAGGDDPLWPSDFFARILTDRLMAAGKQSLLITQPDAGHRVLLPDEITPRSAINAHGGTDAADWALGNAAWSAITALLHDCI